MFLRLQRVLAVLVLALSLVACRSAPVHFYTLVPFPASPLLRAPAPFEFELLPVTVPVENDLPQLVVRSTSVQAQILENERWVGPLSDQVRSALSTELSRELSSRDVSGLARDSQKLVRIKVKLRRFESSYGGYALIDAAWSVRPLWQAKRPALACVSRLRESVGPGYEALVLGHQRALHRLSQRIAVAARRLAASVPVACPVN